MVEGGAGKTLVFMKYIPMFFRHSSKYYADDLYTQDQPHQFLTPTGGGSPSSTGPNQDFMPKHQEGSPDQNIPHPETTPLSSTINTAVQEQGLLLAPSP